MKTSTVHVGVKIKESREVVSERMNTSNLYNVCKPSKKSSSTLYHVGSMSAHQRTGRDHRMKKDISSLQNNTETRMRRSSLPPNIFWSLRSFGDFPWRDKWSFFLIDVTVICLGLEAPSSTGFCSHERACFPSVSCLSWALFGDNFWAG